MKPLKEEIEGYLGTNNSWNFGCPGIPGLGYLESLDKWKVKKIITIRKIVKDLEELEASEGNEFSTLVRSIVAREIAVKNWQAPRGNTFPVWNGIFSRAKGVAKKNLTGRTALDDLSKGMLRK